MLLYFKVYLKLEILSKNIQIAIYLKISSITNGKQYNI